MILDKHSYVTLNPSNIKRYKDLGYIGEINERIQVSIDDLSIGSRSLINVKCDVCGIEKTLEFYLLNKYGYLSKYTCKKCKMKKQIFEKYGVENVFQIEDVKNKIKKTNIKNFGVDNPSKNEAIKEKKKKTSIKNFGTTCHLSSQEIKNKIKKTILSKYGVDNISKVKEIKEKKEQTCLKNNGVKYISQSSNFKKNYKNKILKYLNEKYGVINYIGDYYFLKCTKCNREYEINKRVYQSRRELNVDCCTFCNPVGSFSISGEEKKLHSFIKDNYNQDISNSNKIIFPYEIDVYLPDLKLAFEFNGLYWHNEINKESDYHLNKTELAEKNGIHLIHVYEDDWNFKQDIVKSRILNLLGKSDKIFARKCEIKEIFDNKLVKEFLEKNHTQGFIGSKIKIGLFYNNELISLMTFGNLRVPMGQHSKENSYEMLRFCNKLNTNVVGGASKMFKYFLEKYNPVEIISCADRSWSRGELYEKLGFKLIEKTKPNYYYIINKLRKHRFNYRKDKLVKEGADPNKTEHEIMLDRKIYRIYDSGHLKFRFISVKT